MKKIPIEQGSMVMMRLSPAGEDEVGALERTYEILDDFYYETQDPHSFQLIDRATTVTCKAPKEEILNIARVRNLNSLKVGELIWASSETFKVTLSGQDQEDIETMSYIFLTPSEIQGDTDIDPVLLQPGQEGFLIRLSRMFGIEPNNVHALNLVGQNIIEVYVKYYGLLRHIQQLQEGKPWLLRWVASELGEMHNTSMGRTAAYLHSKMAFPYSSSQIVKALYGDDVDDRDQLSQEA